ncbi:hypothetical protein BBJ29_002963 [Phytophthora kernoviae]|uniref:WW domain-containing protein n=1 Tax=Phytophthora kernoviae TaxID=325452 RepID=A0A3F2RTX5_9STRA|nr:hypothetical protein BBJ29_002963 [Phytophthora kernoviae]RLN64139.1 hypothetical protein BBP00_00003633 [Phytophthora kernoviae]
MHCFFSPPPSPQLISNFSTATDGATKPRRPPPPPLPEPSSIDVDGKCTIEYIDVRPEHLTAATPTLVLIHGAPGTYRDFRHLIPLLQDRGVRVLSLNLPGFGGSEVLDTANYYQHISAFPSVQLTYKAMQNVLKGTKNVFVLGHSFGGHAAVHFTGINADEQQINIKGLVLLAAAGYRPHSALVPRLNDALWQMLRSGIPVLETASKWLIKQLFTRMYQFPDPGFPDYFTAGIVRCASADFSLFAKHIEKNNALPSFLAWAKDDALIEEEIFLDVSAKCHPGPRLAFERGGHNIQKTKAAILSDEMAKWMTNVVDVWSSDMYVRRVKDTHGSLLSDGDERPPGTLLTWTFAFGLNGTNVHKLELRDLEKGEFVVVLDCRELKRVNHEDIHGDMWEFEYDLEDQHELDLVVTLVGDNKVYDFFIDGSSWSDISETEFVLESGWYPVYSRSRSAVYFRNETTGNTQWEAPLMSRKDSHVNRPLQPFEQVSPGSQGLEDLVHDMHAVSVSKQQEETQEEPESEHEHAPQLISMKQPLQPVQEVPEVSEVQEANLLDFSEVAVYSSPVNNPQTNGYEAFDPFNPATHTGFIPQKQEQNNQQTQPPVDLLGI